MHQIKYWLFACLFLLSLPQFSIAEEKGSTDEQIITIEERAGDLVHMDGFFDLYWRPTISSHSAGVSLTHGCDSYSHTCKTYRHQQLLTLDADLLRPQRDSF